MAFVWPTCFRIAPLLEQCVPCIGLCKFALTSIGISDLKQDVFMCWFHRDEKHVKVPCSHHAQAGWLVYDQELFFLICYCFCPFLFYIYKKNNNLVLINDGMVHDISVS